MARLSERRGKASRRFSNGCAIWRFAIASRENVSRCCPEADKSPHFRTVNGRKSPLAGRSGRPAELLHGDRGHSPKRPSSLHCAPTFRMVNPLPVVRNLLRHVSSVTWLLINTGREMGDQMLRGRFPFRLSIFFAQTDRAGVGSIPGRRLRSSYGSSGPTRGS